MAIFRGEKQVAGMGDGNSIPDDLKYLTNTGDGSKYLANDGNYYTINNFGINDVEVTSKTTYSSEKINEKLKYMIDNIILPSQNDAPTMWQKTYLNVASGDTLEMVTSESFTMDKVIVQAYKFVAGETGKVEVLKTFNNADHSNFYYNEENIEFIEFNGGSMKIKNSHTIKNRLNSDGYYESDVIKKSDYVDFDSIVVRERT